jgi:hypothetical protein
MAASDEFLKEVKSTADILNWQQLDLYRAVLKENARTNSVVIPSVLAVTGTLALALGGTVGFHLTRRKLYG